MARIILDTGSVEYRAEDAEVGINELIEALEDAKKQGAETVVLSSGNHRGAKWQKLYTDWEWED